MIKTCFIMIYGNVDTNTKLYGPYNSGTYVFLIKIYINKKFHYNINTYQLY